MSKKIKTSDCICIHVDGIRYEEFSKIKWQQFLRIYSLVLVVILAVVAVSVISGKTQGNISFSGVVAIGLILLAMLAIFRSGIKTEFRKNKLSQMNVTYIFDGEGWTVQRGKYKNTVAWSSTHKMKKNQNALLLYPNKKSVNLVPLRCISAKDLEKIIAWCTGKK